MLKRVGILPGWYGIENGQKPEMEKKKKKMEIEMENGSKLDGGKNGKKWPKNGKLHQKSIFGPFFAIVAPVQLGAVFHFDFHFFFLFFHFRLLAVFHAIPARQDPKKRAP